MLRASELLELQRNCEHRPFKCARLSELPYFEYLKYELSNFNPSSCDVQGLLDTLQAFSSEYDELPRCCQAPIAVEYEGLVNDAHEALLHIFTADWSWSDYAVEYCVEASSEYDCSQSYVSSTCSEGDASLSADYVDCAPKPSQQDIYDELCYFMRRFCDLTRAQSSHTAPDCVAFQDEEEQLEDAEPPEHPPQALQWSLQLCCDASVDQRSLFLEPDVFSGDFDSIMAKAYASRPSAPAADIAYCKGLHALTSTHQEAGERVESYF